MPIRHAHPDHPVLTIVPSPVQPPVDYEELERRIQQADNIGSFYRAHPQFVRKPPTVLLRQVRDEDARLNAPARAARGGSLPDRPSLLRALGAAAVVLVFTYALLTAALVLL